jgi:SAM-dependent methyltransferase
LGGDGITLSERDVADVGCGEGIMDLGLVTKTRPRRFVGYDIARTDADELLRRARHYGAATELPAQLEFAVSDPTRIPAPDSSFDVAISWSAFEHVVQPDALLREVHRILRPDGVLMLQLWPFFYSEHGSHLWHWFEGGFVHLRHSLEEVETTLRADKETDPSWIETKLEHYRELNGMNLDGLHRAILGAGLYVTKLELLSHAVHLTPELNRWSAQRPGNRRG